MRQISIDAFIQNQCDHLSTINEPSQVIGSLFPSQFTLVERTHFNIIKAAHSQTRKGTNVLN